MADREKSVCGHYTPRDLASYRYTKLRLLKDFCIVLNSEQLAHLNSLSTFADIDRYVHDVIRDWRYSDIYD